MFSDAIKLSTKNRLSPDGLYKQCVLINNPRTFYLGMQNQFFTFSMFQLQGWFVRDVISGKHVLPDKEQMIEQNKSDQKTEDNLKTVSEMIHFQVRSIYLQCSVSFMYSQAL